MLAAEQRRQSGGRAAEQWSQHSRGKATAARRWRSLVVEAAEPLAERGKLWKCSETAGRQDGSSGRDKRCLCCSASAAAAVAVASLPPTPPTCHCLCAAIAVPLLRCSAALLLCCSAALPLCRRCHRCSAANTALPPLLPSCRPATLLLAAAEMLPPLPPPPLLCCHCRAAAVLPPLLCLCRCCCPASLPFPCTSAISLSLPPPFCRLRHLVPPLPRHRCLARR